MVTSVLLKSLKMSLFIGLIVVISNIDMNLFFKIILYTVSGYGILYYLTIIALIVVDGMIRKQEIILFEFVCYNFERMLILKKNYDEKFPETKQFHEMFDVLVTSSDKQEIVEAAEFFQNYNRFGCKELPNEFLKILLTYSICLSKLSEENITKHREKFIKK